MITFFKYLWFLLNYRRLHIWYAGHGSFEVRYVKITGWHIGQYYKFFGGMTGWVCETDPERRELNEFVRARLDEAREIYTKASTEEACRRK